MPTAQLNRERLRGGLLGPLGEETTDMLMQELDLAGLRAHVDERFAEIDRRFAEIDRRFTEIDRRFEEIDRRFEEIDRRFERMERELADIKTAINSLTAAVHDASRPSTAIVYTVCGAVALITLTAMLNLIFGG